MNTETPKPARSFSKQPKGHVRFGREVLISPKSHATVNGPGLVLEYTVDTVDVEISIGSGAMAHLVMSVPAWEMLKGGGEVGIETIQEFKKNIG